jgi:hypothetical protein
MKYQFAAVTLATFVASCGGSSGTQTSSPAMGTLAVEATDGPISPTLVSEATIWVDRLYVSPESKWEEVYNGAPVQLDLLDLRNGFTQLIAQAELPEGKYSVCRLHLTDAFLELTNGNQYSTQLGNLHLSAHDKSGYKVYIDPPVVIGAGQASTLLLDFDLSKTFHPEPNSDPFDATTYSLHPILRATPLEEAGEIRGVATTEDDSGFTPVPSAMVYVLQPGETNTSLSIASTLTGIDGSFAVIGLPAGSYDVFATNESIEGRLDGVVVLPATTTDIELLLQ